MLNLSVRFVVYYLKHKTVPLPPVSYHKCARPKIYFRSCARREFCHLLGSFPRSSHDNIGIRSVFVGNWTVGLENSAFDIHLVKVRLFFLWSGLPTPTSEQRSQLLDQSRLPRGRRDDKYIDFLLRIPRQSEPLAPNFKWRQLASNPNLLVCRCGVIVGR
jgi:hypothetical protein